MHYILVSNGVYPNTFKAYHNLLVPALVKWRREGDINIDAFEDRTRRILQNEYGIFHNRPLGRMKQLLREAIERARNFEYAAWYRQPYKVLVAVEKQASEGTFQYVCNQMDVDLAVMRGYSSVSYTKEIADHLKRYTHERKVVILYFGDMDPSGLNIPETLERDLYGMFDVEFKLERIAVTHKQISEMNLIPAPVKMGDTRATKFIEQHGEDVYELEAIEPKTLQQIIRDNINRYYDKNINNENKKQLQATKKKINDAINDSSIEESIDDLPDDEE
jgi:hypothetical protein